ncbi:phosphoglycerate mutase family protein [Moelleriella libera RCEF 2490]|uniref:Phosphoglycerate mutase family protein n=1 Tax=Moelleriella libera RCEF 2490 TaxID=1081109 RepID=A0A168CJ33_9HYPO|nr:phosphoglycerate mutase family protein [Moelleriella libera RCEF 2490]
MTTAATIHLVRHAQGFHNLSEENESLHDPDLTPLGEQQCADLRASFPSHDKLVRLVASPLRRTIYTAELSFGRPSLHPIVLLDLLQEVSASPCDTGSSKAELAAEFGDKVDLGSVRDAWTEKGPGSVFEPSLEALTARAKLARKALKKLLDEAGGGDVAVVTHGGFLHFLTDDWEDVPSNKATAWTNCMCRSYRFTEAPDDDDDDVRLVETEESWRCRQPEHRKQLTWAEQRQLRAAVQKRVGPYLKIKSASA